MNIKRLVIENFKSIERIELIEPNPFTVFVGPNGSGKSNIFEALEFVNRCSKIEVDEAIREFGGAEKISNRNIADITKLHIFISDENSFSDLAYSNGALSFTKAGNKNQPFSASLLNSIFTKGLEFLSNFSRIFVRNSELQKTRFPYQDNQRLSLSASNLESVLKRILQNPVLRDEIFEWLALFVPGFKAVEIDDRNELHWFEEDTVGHFTKDLISDGTYNILALLTAVYQSEEPQFLCIEEVENGLHPEVILSLIDFFRKQCAEKGHYIWLNTHSETVVKLLTTDEIVLVNKRNGATITKQVKGMNTYSLTTDEAWLTGALGGGLAW
jgi:predicted ATPase